MKLSFATTSLVAASAFLVLANAQKNNMVKMCLFYNNPSGHARSDPIIDTQCASGHVHTFYGPQNFHPDTGYEMIRDTPAKFSSTPYVENQSLYWHPTIYKVTDNADGTKTWTRAPTIDTSPYYRWDNTVSPRTEAFPPGFRMIAHSNDAGANQGGESEGNMLTECCNIVNDEEECQSWDRLKFPTRTCDFLGIAFAMPTCWNDESLGDDNDHKSHMAYTTNGDVNGPCPKGFNRRLPQVQLFVRITNYQGGTYQLSDGSDVFHVDFFNGWKEGTLQNIIDNCKPVRNAPIGYNPPCGCTPDQDDSTFVTINENVAPPVCDADVRRLIIDEATDIVTGTSLPLGSCEGPTLKPRSWTQITDDLFQCSNPKKGKTIFKESFEKGYGKFVGGKGKDSAITGSTGYKSASSLMLRDNTKSSVAKTRKAYDISSYSKVVLSFHYKSKRVREDQSFLVQYSIDGAKWKNLKRFMMGRDFEENHVWKKATVVFRRADHEDGKKIRFRFISQLPTDATKVFIDNVQLKGFP